jgi:signal recognition particle subunit SRP54
VEQVGVFDALSSKLSDVFDRLTRRGALKEADVEEAMREVRLALLEADVALPVARDFVERATQKAIGQEILRSVTPGQMVVKIVHDCLIEMLGEGGEGSSALNFSASPPVAILMVGLQGSGKTTTSAKLGARLTSRERKKVLLAGLDVARPAAQEQLRVLGEQGGVASLAPVFGERPVAIARRAMETARREGYDVVILDTAGRLSIDMALMAEVAEIRGAVKPTEVLLVADALSGQDAVNTAKEFNERVGITGIVLTRVDGDARGGAALSMRAVTGRPIKLMGVGEKLDALEAFDPMRVAGRILGMGDVVGLVEKASQNIDRAEAEKTAKRALRGQFTLDDLSDQLGQIAGMGDLGGLIGMIPGISKMKKQIESANIDNKMLVRQRAIIRSMTKAERANPKLLNAKRRVRIANGSGTSVQDVNKLLKQFQQMSDMMKKMGSMGKRGLFGGGMPPMMPPGFPGAR